MKLLKFIIQFRFKQLFRMLKSVGWLLLLAIPLFGVYFLGILQAAKTTNAYVIAGVLSFILISIHFYRKDGRFLQHLNVSRRLIFLIEYNIALLPTTLPLLIMYGKWEIFLITHSVAFLIVFLNPGIFAKQNSKVRPIPNFIPIELFEWRSGLRQYFYYAIGLYVLGLVFCNFIGTTLIVTILFGMMAVSFYEEIEPKELLENIHFKSNVINRKIGTHSALFHVLLLPQYLLFLLFHSNYWYLLLIAIMLSELLLLFAIFYKYAVYRPRRRRTFNQTATGLFLGGFLIPFLAPGSLWYLITFWRRAVKRIKYFYADNQ